MSKNAFYIVPNLKKVSGGPKTRISMFRKLFIKYNNRIIEGNNKLIKSFRLGKRDLTYVESATNRITAIDFFSLLLVRWYSKDVIVFIRDIYVELFPEEFKSFRKRITLYANKISYFFLTLIADKLVFPTEKMGEVFYQKNYYFPKRKYFALPPGTVDRTHQKEKPDFSQKIGILYLGSITYVNSGFGNFLNFAETFQENYNFHVLSGDRILEKVISGRTYIHHDSIDHKAIESYIGDHNIAFAFHSRPRNSYDDLTYPIKIFDFITFRLPIITTRHVPLYNLLGQDYPLFVDVENAVKIEEIIKRFTDKKTYNKLLLYLDKVSAENTYEKRYLKLLAEGLQ